MVLYQPLTAATPGGMSSSVRLQQCIWSGLCLSLSSAPWRSDRSCANDVEPPSPSASPNPTTTINGASKRWRSSARSCTAAIACTSRLGLSGKRLQATSGDSSRGWTSVRVSGINRAGSWRTALASSTSCPVFWPRPWSAWVRAVTVVSNPTESMLSGINFAVSNNAPIPGPMGNLDALNAWNTLMCSRLRCRRWGILISKGAVWTCSVCPGWRPYRR